MKKVIIIKSLPRYEFRYNDPFSLKSDLNDFGNDVYDKLWKEEGRPKDIEIVNLGMECEGKLRAVRFGIPGYVGSDGNICDGVHLRGPQAVHDLTNSFLRILPQVSLEDKTTKDRSKHLLHTTQSKRNVYTVLAHNRSNSLN